ncbi:putative ammonium transporter 3 [Mizuhopecten yessoensis]|uniref:Ammonium transporter n=1 Tax=Mizuhopecten yessoensis TaxID=6573 RepID=A0A210PR83_MIZYE|nr:putative ammonium transporter 3 [Mizuhopecten yessoensis]OWF39017.1 ammonium transporter 3 [Mizuhopecten yessoensis]
MSNPNILVVTNTTTSVPVTGEVSITWDDATWILTSSFIIFTMQSGFGLLEAGAVTNKNEVNIMVKNAADVIFGGLTYWSFGFGLSFGKDQGANMFCGVGNFFVDADDDQMGVIFSTFVFQLSFATTATTIVSGAMAERTKLCSYIIFSCVNTVVYCIPAHWLWDDIGFLRKLGVVDIAGAGAVHLIGGGSALVAAVMLKPRSGRYDHGTESLPMGNPVNSLLGTFMLWWGWLGFNCGSTFGISGGKWKLAAKSAVVTLCGSIGGGVIGITTSYITRKRKFEIEYIVNSILGGLVSITAACAIIRPWEALIAGAVGGFIAIHAPKFFNWLHVDDPVGAVSVHGVVGIWGLMVVGLFTENDHLENLTLGRSGLIHGGGFYLLGVQMMAALILSTWSSLCTFILLFPIKMTIGIRLSPHEEFLGADYVEHNIVHKETNIIFSRPSTARDRAIASRANLNSVVCDQATRRETVSVHSDTQTSISDVIALTDFPDQTVNSTVMSGESKPRRGLPPIPCCCCKHKQRALVISS